MDTSEAYIKMCEKAEEIQQQAPNRFYSHKDWFVEIIRGGAPIWLSRQDQLQEMVDKYEYEYPSGLEGLQESYHRFVNRTVLTDNISSIFGTIPEYQYCQSWEQLWMAFVMKEKYNKIWDGENWREAK